MHAQPLSLHQPFSRPLRLREILTRLLNRPLDSQQQCCLPLIQLTQLIVLKQFISKHLLIALLHRCRQIHKQLVLALLREGRVEVAVLVHGCVDADHVAGAELADARFEEVLFYGPAHEVIGDGGAGYFFVEFAGRG